MAVVGWCCLLYVLPRIFLKEGWGSHQQSIGTISFVIWCSSSFVALWTKSDPKSGKIQISIISSEPFWTFLPVVSLPLKSKQVCWFSHYFLQLKRGRAGCPIEKPEPGINFAAFSNNFAHCATSRPSSYSLLYTLPKNIMHCLIFKRFFIGDK